MKQQTKPHLPLLYKPLFWLVMSLAYLISRLPITVLYNLGKWLGRLIMFCSKEACNVASTNLKLCFPELSEDALQARQKEYFESFGQTLIEVLLCTFDEGERFTSLSKLEGIENLNAALAEGNGVILLACHLLSPDAGGVVLIKHTRFAAMYTPPNNPVARYYLEKYRGYYLKKIFPASNVRSMIKALKQNLPVWYACDLDVGPKNSMFVPFFNQPAATSTALLRLVEMTGAKVVPLLQARQANGYGYQLNLLPALENFPSQDSQADLIRVNQLIENSIQKQPSHYFWHYRRFRTRPDNAPSLYNRSYPRLKVIPYKDCEKDIESAELLEGSKEKPLLMKDLNGYSMKFFYQRSRFPKWWLAKPVKDFHQQSFQQYRHGQISPILKKIFYVEDKGYYFITYKMSEEITRQEFKRNPT